jgi:predicted nucleotidyltransferase
MGPKPTKPAGGSSIADALFFGVQQRVLGALFGNADRTFYVNELLRLTGSGKGALLRELDRLVGAGLVTVRTIGNQKHYQASRESPIFEELRGIVVKTFGVADVLREALLPLAKKIRAVFVYGSIAKGTATAASDIDLLVVSDRLSYPDLFAALQAVEQQLGRKVNPTVYTPVELKQKLAERNAFAMRVLDQSKIFIIGSEDELRESRKPGQGRQAQGRSARPQGVRRPGA